MAGHGMMIVPYETATAEDWLALSNMLRATPISLAEFRAREACWPASDFRLRVVGRDVALGQLSTAPYAPPDHLALVLFTHPTHRRRGVGSMLLDYLVAETARHGYGALAASVPEAECETQRWARGRGFVQHAVRFDGVLDLAQGPVDDGLLAVSVPPGVVLSDMTGATEDQWQSVLALFSRLLAETPDMEGLPPWTQERCRAVLRDNPSARADWTILARHGHEDIGLTAGHALGGDIYSFFTGVVSPWRRQGIALALKRRLIAVARAQGIATLRTTNLDRNRPALQMNDTLGFRRTPGSVEMRRPIAV